MKGWLLVLLLLLGLLAAALFLYTSRPLQPAAEFVEPQTCFECHEEQQKEWLGSHHQLAMQPARPDTVLADFGAREGFEEKDGAYFFEGKPIRYVFGIDPLQQVLVDIGGGRLQAHPISWDVAKKRWFDLDLGYPWDHAQLNWNYMCAECHSTNLQRNYDVATDTYATTYHEVSVGCQACHGPGSRHVAWARRHQDKEYAVDDPKGLVVRLKDRDPAVEVDTCARCHSRRNIVSGAYRHGEPFLDHYAPVYLDEPLYHADGQIRDEVYVYGSFLQSKMHSKGVRCSDCHNSHSARLKLEGNLVCIRCHKEDPPVDTFPTLKSKNYDTPEHHFHEKEPVTCVQCHMIERTYMVVDPRHDHSFRIPRPDLKTPNACNDCHKDRSAQWAADEIAKRAARPPATHWIEKKPEEVVLDRTYPAIVRATAVRRVAGRLALKAEALKDEEPLVRAAAVESLEGAPPHELRRLLKPLLTDPIRLVRTEAARVASAAGPWDNAGFRAALAEFTDRQKALADRAESYLNLAVVYTNLGDAVRAEELYRTALSRDESFVPARFNLANLLNSQGRNAEAEVQLRLVLKHEPGHPEAYYSLGLLLAELERYREAADHLAEAVKRMPRRVRVRYNLALVLQRLGRFDDAEKELLAAYALRPRDADVLNALVHFYRGRRDAHRARRFAAELASLGR